VMLAPQYTRPLTTPDQSAVLRCWSGVWSGIGGSENPCKSPGGQGWSGVEQHCGPTTGEASRFCDECRTQTLCAADGDCLIVKRQAEAARAAYERRHRWRQEGGNR
jgi:hypothetical protein